LLADKKRRVLYYELKDDSALVKKFWKINTFAHKKREETPLWYKKIICLGISTNMWLTEIFIKSLHWRNKQKKFIHSAYAANCQREYCSVYKRPLLKTKANRPVQRKSR